MVSMTKQTQQRAKQASVEKEVNKITTDIKRYNLALPTNVYNEVAGLAQQEGASVLELLKRLIKIGLVVLKAAHSPDTSVIIREGNTETKLVLL
jgi:hypothetical protein